MAPSYKLTYFNGQGRAESIRWILAAANQKYEDERVDMEKWKTIKPTTPFEGLPILQAEGVTLAQSSAISLYLAQKFNLFGKKDIQKAQIHMIFEGLNEMFETYVRTKFAGSDAAKADNKKKWDDELKAKYLRNLEKLVQPDSFFVGGALTVVDIAVAQFLNDSPDAIDLSSYPKLQANKDKVVANPGIAKWISSRPKQLPF